MKKKNFKNKEYYIKTPEIIRETLGQEVYDLFEKYAYNYAPRKPYPFVMGRALYEKWNQIMKELWEKQNKIK